MKSVLYHYNAVEGEEEIHEDEEVEKLVKGENHRTQRRVLADHRRPKANGRGRN
jgi:hypothetical protein